MIFPIEDCDALLSFNTTDQFGRRSGYAYDYQKKIAAYTGWNYEYVVGI